MEQYRGQLVSDKVLQEKDVKEIDHEIMLLLKAGKATRASGKSEAMLARAAQWQKFMDQDWDQSVDTSVSKKLLKTTLKEMTSFVMRNYSVK